MGVGFCSPVLIGFGVLVGEAFEKFGFWKPIGLLGFKVKGFWTGCCTLGLIGVAGF